MSLKMEVFGIERYDSTNSTEDFCCYCEGGLLKITY